MGFGDTLTLGPYRLVCQSFTQDSNRTTTRSMRCWMCIKGSKKITQLAPEKRFYHREPDVFDDGGAALDAGE